MYNTHKYTRIISISFLFLLETTSRWYATWGSEEADTWRQREDAFYLSRACARWFATAILVSFDSPCGLSVWISVTEVCVWYGRVIVRLKFTGEWCTISRGISSSLVVSQPSRYYVYIPLDWIVTSFAVLVVCEKSSVGRYIAIRSITDVIYIV